MKPFATPDKRLVEMDYATILKMTDRENLQKKCSKKLIGYEDTIAEIKAKLSAYKNFIVTGSSGVGKTTVIRRLAQGSKFNFFHLDARWLKSRLFDPPEKILSCVFKEAKVKEPSIIFIDNFDGICESKRTLGDIKERAFDWLEGQLEDLELETNKVVVIIAIYDLGVLDSKMLKYFKGVIRFRLPDHSDRFKMLKTLFPKFKSEELEEIADATVCHLYHDLREILDIARTSDPTGPTFDSVKATLSSYKPKTVLDHTTPCPNVRWEDIGGVEATKKKLQDTVIDPLKHRKEYSRHKNLKMAKGALLYGPPGCSKTMLAQALATESGFNYKYVKGPELLSKYVGDSEKAIRELYRTAREIAPCIIFFDEIDTFANHRSDRSHDGSSVNDRVVGQLLAEFNVQGDNVFTLAATNRPDKIDEALLRPGRLSKIIHIPLPSESDRAEIFKVHMKLMSINLESQTPDELAKELASLTENYSGADISEVCSEASLLAIQEKIRQESAIGDVEKHHFLEALAEVKPSSERCQELYTTIPDHHRETSRLNERFNDSLNLN